MSETKKPRLCEVLGVEVEEKFWFKDGDSKAYYIDKDGVIYCKEDGGLYIPGYTVCYAINHPDLIIRKPRLTEPELAICRAMGAKWVSMDDDDHRNVDLWDEKPVKCGEIYRLAATNRHFLAHVSAHLFPSVKPDDCICVEEIAG